MILRHCMDFLNHAWWYACNPNNEGLRQMYQEFEPGMSYIVRLVLEVQFILFKIIRIVALGRLMGIY